jgi:hypothetical protein
VRAEKCGLYFFEETVNNSHKAASKGSRFQSLRLLFVKDTEMWNYDKKKNIIYCKKLRVILEGNLNFEKENVFTEKFSEVFNSHLVTLL